MGSCAARLRRLERVSSAPFRDRFLRACRLQPVDRTPVWFMRQAGRYLPEYRELRGDRDILETCRDPEQVVEITLQPLRRMDLDAAIVFSDIMVPLAGVGVDVRIEPGRGPVIDDAGRARGRPRRAPPARAGGRRARRCSRRSASLRKELARAADRVRGRAVHARELPDRGRSEPRPTSARRR